MTTTNDAHTAFEHTLGVRGRVTIRLASAELRLRGGTDDRVIVRTPDGSVFPDRLIIEPVDGAVTIREKESLGLTFGIGRRTIRLDIQVPAEAEVGIDTASGWIETDGLKGEQRFKTVSGEVRLRGASGTIELAAVSGEATIELDGAAGLAVRSVSGDVRVAGGRIEKLHVATTSGDIRIDSELSDRAGHSIETLSGDVELVADGGVRVEARTVSGDLSTDLPHRTEGRMGRRAMIVGDGATQLGFRSVSGDLRIRERSGSRSAAASGRPAMPAIPNMPSPPAPPRAPSLPPAPGRSPGAAPVTDPPSPADEERMTILRALERGELDVAAAMARLAELDEEASDG